MPIELTPDLAARCLDVWERRQRDPRNTVYPRSLLDAAISGLPDFPPRVPPRKIHAGLKRPPTKRDKRVTLVNLPTFDEIPPACPRCGATQHYGVGACGTWHVWLKFDEADAACGQCNFRFRLTGEQPAWKAYSLRMFM